MNNIPIEPKYFDFDAIGAVKTKTITTDDLQLLFLSDMALLLGDIIARIRCRNGFEDIREDDIFYRDYIEKMIPDNSWHTFSALKQAGYIGVCGRGYTIDGRIKLSEAEHKRITDIIFCVLPDAGYY